MFASSESTSEYKENNLWAGPNRTEKSLNGLVRAWVGRLWAWSAIKIAGNLLNLTISNRQLTKTVPNVGQSAPEPTPSSTSTVLWPNK